MASAGRHAVAGVLIAPVEHQVQRGYPVRRGGWLPDERIGLRLGLHGSLPLAGALHDALERR